MTDIQNIDPVDFAGAIGHTAAGQLYAILSGEDPNVTNWFSGDEGRVEKDIYQLAQYVSRTYASGETLWRHSRIEKIGDFAASSFEDLPLARRLAFNLFASVSALAFSQVLQAQEDFAAAEKTAASGVAASPLKIEDSIFEPHGSLGDQEAYQAQWLQDQQAADQAALERKKRQEEEAAAAISAGAPIDDDVTEETRPAALSVGQQPEGTAHAQETADQGPEPGGTPEADPGAQGSVSELVDDGDALQRAAPADGEGGDRDPDPLGIALEAEEGDPGGESHPGETPDEGAGELKAKKGKSPN